jgi:hypothetical protein
VLVELMCVKSASGVPSGSEQGPTLDPHHHDQERRSYPGAAERSGHTRVPGITEVLGGRPSRRAGWLLDRGSGPDDGLQPPAGSTTCQRTPNSRPDTRLFDRYPLLVRSGRTTRQRAPSYRAGRGGRTGAHTQPAKTSPANASRALPGDLCMRDRPVPPPTPTELPETTPANASRPTPRRVL